MKQNLLHVLSLMTLDSIADIREGAPIVAGPRTTVDAFRSFAVDVYESDDEPRTMRSPTFGPSVTMADVFFGGAK